MKRNCHGDRQSRYELRIFECASRPSLLEMISATPSLELDYSETSSAPGAQDHFPPKPTLPALPPQPSLNAQAQFSG